MTTAADILVPFDAVFVHARCPRGICSWDVWQMIGRARVVRGLKIYVTMQTQRTTRKKNSEVPVNTEQEIRTRHKGELKWIKECKSVRTSFQDERVQQMRGAYAEHSWVNAEVTITWRAEWVLNMWAWHSAEKQESFPSAFRRLALAQGHTFGLDTEANQDMDTAQKLKRHKKLYQEENKKIRLELLKHMQDSCTFEDVRQMHTSLNLKQAASLTPAEQIQKDYTYILKYYPDRFRQLTPESVNYAHKHVALVFNARWALRLTDNEGEYTTEEGKKRDFSRLRTAVEPETSSMTFQTVQCCDKLIRRLGYYGFKDDTTWRTLEQIKKRTATLKNCQQVLEKTRAVRAGRTNEPLDILRWCLRHVGMTLVSKRVSLSEPTQNKKRGSGRKKRRERQKMYSIAFNNKIQELLF